MKILIIDDSLIARRIHKNILIEHNVPESDLIEALDGEEAMRICKNETIDLILVDWNMPRLNGFNFVKIIRGLPAYASTPIIMITSEAAKYNVMEAINAGVSNYIVKPVSSSSLWEKISKYFGK